MCFVQECEAVDSMSKNRLMYQQGREPVVKVGSCTEVERELTAEGVECLTIRQVHRVMLDWYYTNGRREPRDPEGRRGMRCSRVDKCLSIFQSDRRVVCV